MPSFEYACKGVYNVRDVTHTHTYANSHFCFLYARTQHTHTLLPSHTLVPLFVI